jgi:DNA-binding response OmpR family regulator
MAKILVIEDELKIQQIIKAYLEKEDYEVQVAGNGAKGLQLIRESKPDLVILDLMLPELPGEQLLAELRQTSNIPVLILSAKSSEEEKIFGLNIGADDYLAKPFSPRELVARVNAHLRRMQSFQAGSGQPSLLSFHQKKLVIDVNKHEVWVDGNLTALTPTEFKILQLLAQVPGQVFTRGQLVEQVQGYSYDGFDRSMDSHIKNLRHKIEPNPDEPVFIITIFGVGYKFGGERDV